MNTTPMRRRRSTALALAASLAVGAVTVVTAAPSSADVTSHYFASTHNASDPFVFKCVNNDKWCMVTSQDMNLGTVGKYPMERTLGFVSNDGLAWSSASTVIHEDNIPGVGTNANHLWAPAVRYVDDPRSSSNDYYVLYTPDLTDANNHLSSRIFVSVKNGSSFPGAFTPDGQISGAPAGLYMSDPEVFSDAENYKADTSKDYLIWADGDNGTCGGISMRKMTSHKAIQPFTNPGDVDVVFNGWPSWATCRIATTGATVNRPYVEGASLFKLSRFKYAEQNPVPGPYTMLLSVKPRSVPAECAVAGQPNTANEVIAYATATNVTGPYTYKGIIMCGSSTEWTNQGSIEEVKTADGEYRLVYVYHDGPSGANNRKLHSECLFTRSSGTFLLTARSPEGAVNINGTRQWCLNENADTIVTLRAYNTGRYVKSSGGQLTVQAATPGLWEQYAAVYSNGKFYLNARHENRWVQSNQHRGGILEARGTSRGAWEAFTFEPVDNGLVMKDSFGKYVRIESSGRLRADTTKANASVFRVEDLAR